MSESEKLSSGFSSKKFYVIVAIGLLIFAGGALFAYGAKTKLSSDTLLPEERSQQTLIFVVSQMTSLIGFIVALIPSVKILQNTVQKEKAASSQNTALSSFESQKEEEKKE